MSGMASDWRSSMPYELTYYQATEVRAAYRAAALELRSFRTGLERTAFYMREGMLDCAAISLDSAFTCLRFAAFRRDEARRLRRMFQGYPADHTPFNWDAALR